MVASGRPRAAGAATAKPLMLFLAFRHLWRAYESCMPSPRLWRVDTPLVAASLTRPQALMQGWVEKESLVSTVCACIRNITSLGTAPLKSSTLLRSPAWGKRQKGVPPIDTKENCIDHHWFLGFQGCMVTPIAIWHTHSATESLNDRRVVLVIS